MTDVRLILVLTTAICALLASCGSHGTSKEPTPVHEEWKIQSSLEVREGQLDTGKYRLIVPFTVGDLYGGPDSKTYMTPTVNEDGTFELDLNLGHDALLAELAAIEAPVKLRDNRMALDPRDTRIAKISPHVVDKRFKELGNANWVDPETGHTLLLMYFDRPARLTGNDFDAEVTEAGYVWVELPSSPEIAHVVPQPESVVLTIYEK